MSFIGAGTCTIDANQGGNATFAPASQVQQPFAVRLLAASLRKRLRLRRPRRATRKSWVPTYRATAHGDLWSAGRADDRWVLGDGVRDQQRHGELSSAPVPARSMRTRAAMRPTRAGIRRCSNRLQSLLAGGITAQTITFTSIAPNNAIGRRSTYHATAARHASGLPVVLTIDGSSATVCTINNGTVTFIGAGTCMIDANQGGNATYAAGRADAADRSRSLRQAVSRRRRSRSLRRRRPRYGRRSDVSCDGDLEARASRSYLRSMGCPPRSARSTTARVADRHRRMHDRREPGRQRDVRAGRAGAAIVRRQNGGGSGNHGAGCGRRRDRSRPHGFVERHRSVIRKSTDSVLDNDLDTRRRSDDGGQGVRSGARPVPVQCGRHVHLSDQYRGRRRQLHVQGVRRIRRVLPRRR